MLTRIHTAPLCVVECVCPFAVMMIMCALYVWLQSKAEGKTAAATPTAAASATPTTTATGEREATPTDKKDKPRSERKRVRRGHGVLLELSVYSVYDRGGQSVKRVILFLQH